MYKFSDLWQAFLGMMIRFFDHRFNAKENKIVYLLRLELEKEQVNNRRLIDHLISGSMNSSRLESDEPAQTPLPVGTTNWKTKARQLEQESRQRRQMINEAEAAMKQNTARVNPEATKSIEALEDELGIGGIN